MLVGVGFGEGAGFEVEVLVGEGVHDAVGEVHGGYDGEDVAALALGKEGLELGEEVWVGDVAAGEGPVAGPGEGDPGAMVEVLGLEGDEAVAVFSLESGFAPEPGVGLMSTHAVVIDGDHQAKLLAEGGFEPALVLDPRPEHAAPVQAAQHGDPGHPDKGAGEIQGPGVAWMVASHGEIILTEARGQEQARRSLRFVVIHSLLCIPSLIFPLLLATGSWLLWFLGD
jgi:hypothetical protein